MKFYLLSILVCLIPFVAKADHTCPYCDGTGKVVRNLQVSQFGHSKEVKVKCETCGIMYYPSTGHTHIHCKHCGGTGIIKDSSSSSYSSSGRTLSDIAIENPAAFSAAMSIKYGIPMNNSEVACVNALDFRLQKLYMQYRNILENDIIFCNQSIAMSWYKNMTTNSVNQRANETFEKVQSALQAIGNYIQSHPSNGWSAQMDNIAENHANNCRNSLMQLYKVVESNQNMQQLQDQIWNYQLFQNLF